MTANQVRKLAVVLGVAILLVPTQIGAGGGSTLAAAQEPQAKPAPKPPVPLKVSVLIGRYQGEKRTASLPFTLMVNSDDNQTSSMRMQSEVPIPSGGAPQSPSFMYKTIGTSIDIQASSTNEEGRFRLSVRINDSQIFTDVPGKTASASPTGMSGIPAFQTFTSSTFLMLRDGQTAQYVTATDKITGEVIKVDVTLNIAK